MVAISSVALRVSRASFLDLGRDDRKRRSRLTCPLCFNGGVQCEHVGRLCNHVDRFAGTHHLIHGGGESADFLAHIDDKLDQIVEFRDILPDRRGTVAQLHMRLFGKKPCLVSRISDLCLLDFEHACDVFQIGALFLQGARFRHDVTDDTGHIAAFSNCRPASPRYFVEYLPVRRAYLFVLHDFADPYVQFLRIIRPRVP